MKEHDITTSNELLSRRKWTGFLKSLPFGITSWEVKNYKDALALRVIAIRLTDRAYSIKFLNNSDTRIIIEVRGKNTPTGEKD